MAGFKANGPNSSIDDANGNELLKFGTTASAVNEATLTNAATGSNPSLAPTGGDTNIGLTVQGKGTGLVGVGDSGTATATAGAATLNKQRGVVTSETGLTTAAGADYTLTLTNDHIAATSLVFVSVQQGTNTTEGISVQRVTPGSGSVVILIRNTHASAAWNGSIKVSYFVLPA